MNSFRTMLAGLFLTLALAVPGQAADHHAMEEGASDEAKIRATALDYIEGWYEGDAERMERALHPHLAKRIRASELEVQATPVITTTASELVGQVAAGGGSRTPAQARRTDVDILDIFEGAASVRVDAGGWIDYMHLAKFGGEWKIVNVLWEVRHGQD